jgi:hypothetical protein
MFLDKASMKGDTDPCTSFLDTCECSNPCSSTSFQDTVLLIDE